MHRQPRVQRLLAGTGETFNLIIINNIIINIITIIIILINSIILIIMLAKRHNMIFRWRSADNPILTTSWWFWALQGRYTLCTTTHLHSFHYLVIILHIFVIIISFLRFYLTPSVSHPAVLATSLILSIEGDFVHMFRFCLDSCKRICLEIGQ